MVWFVPDPTINFNSKTSVKKNSDCESGPPAGTDNLCLKQLICTLFIEHAWKI